MKPARAGRLKAPRWKRSTIPAEGDQPECIADTIEVGAFTVDAMEDCWEIEGFASGTADSILHAKHHALLAAHAMLLRWTAQIDAALTLAERRLRARERNQGEP